MVLSKVVHTRDYFYTRPITAFSIYSNICLLATLNIISHVCIVCFLQYWVSRARWLCSICLIIQDSFLEENITAVNTLIERAVLPEIIGCWPRKETVKSNSSSSSCDKNILIHNYYYSSGKKNFRNLQLQIM